MVRLRKASSCVVCGTVRAAGSPALFFPQSKTVRCLACPGDPLVTYPQPPYRGIPGASAQGEHDRLVAERWAYIQQTHRLMGGLVFATTPPPQAEQAWAQGAWGERALAQAFARTPWVIVLHDRRVAGTRGNIDHIVIGPAGLFVVDTKCYRGRIRVWHASDVNYDRLYVANKDRSALADNMRWQVEAVNLVLESVQHLMPVTPVLCFVGASWPRVPPMPFRGVLLESPASLERLLTSRPIIDGWEIERLARVLAVAFPAK
jgi:hypothetical protein